jgi:hypothetical protein
MKTILLYKVVSETTMYALNSCVQVEISNGWQPQGGVSFDGRMYIQALVTYTL